RTRGNDFAISTVLSSLKLSTTTMSFAQLSAPSERAMFGASLYVSMSGVIWSSILALPCVANHVLPEPGRAAVERKAEIIKTVVPHQFRERVDAEEFDVTAIVQR